MICWPVSSSRFPVGSSATRMAGFGASARAELVSVGLGDRLDHYPAQLSGGEQQRVAVARALAPDPAILVADEPTGNLDEDTGRQIIELLFAGHAKRGSTLVLVTHDAALAQRCGRVVRLRSGRIDGVSSSTSPYKGEVGERSSPGGGQLEN